MNKIFTIIVTYNAMKWIDNCIRCLIESTVHTKIIVVDNCSTDKTVEYISTAYPNVIVIQNKQNKGFGQANNQGIELAYRNGASHFFLCNQDLYVKPNTLGNLVEIQNKYHLSVVSPVQLNGDFSSFDGGFFSSFIENNSNLDFVSDVYLDNVSDYYETAYVPAAAWMLSKETIQNIGGFDPLFFHYGEDNHYANRLKFHRKKLAVVPSAIVGHDRVFKGNIDAFKKYSPCSTLINAFADPNDPIMKLNKKRMEAIIINLRNSCLSFLRFNFKDAWLSLKSLCQFFSKLGMIKNSVIINRNINSNWLDL